MNGRRGLPEGTRGSPWPPVPHRAVASSARFDLGGKWNGSRDAASGAPSSVPFREQEAFLPGPLRSGDSRTRFALSRSLPTSAEPQRRSEMRQYGKGRRDSSSDPPAIEPYETAA